MKEINLELFNIINTVDNAQVFVDTYKEAAMSVEKDTGLNFIAILAAAAIESGWGLKAIENNFFGIKSNQEGKRHLMTTTEILWTDNAKFPEVITKRKRSDGRYEYKVKDWFKSYTSPEDSFKDYADFFVRNPRYNEAWKFRYEYDSFFEEIAKAGYATAPNYATSLKAVAKSVIRRL